MTLAREPLTASASSTSSSSSATLSAKSFALDSTMFSAQLTKASYSKEVVKSTTLPLILETQSAGSDNLTNGSLCEENEIKDKDDEWVLHPPQSNQTDLTVGDAKPKCICCARNSSVSHPLDFLPAFAADIESELHISTVKVISNVYEVTNEGHTTRLPSFTDYTSALRTEDANENETVTNFRNSDSVDNKHKTFLCSLSKVFGSMERMDRNSKERQASVSMPNSTFNELYCACSSKSIPVYLAPRRDKISMESVHDRSDYVDGENITCHHHGTRELLTGFVSQKEKNIEERKHDTYLHEETVSNSSSLRNDIDTLHLSSLKLYSANKDYKIPQENETKMNVLNPVSRESSGPVSSLHLLSLPGRKTNKRSISKYEEKLPTLASFNRDQFRNYIPYPISPYSQKNITPGSNNDTRKDLSTSNSIALKPDSCVLIKVTPNVSQTERKQKSVQETDQPMIPYSIVIEISPDTNSSHSPQTQVKDESDDKGRKHDDVTHDDENRRILSRDIATSKEIIEKDKCDEVPSEEKVYNTRKSNTHSIILSTANNEQSDLVKKTDDVKKNISYALLIEISTLTPSPEDSVQKHENEESLDKHSGRDSNSVKEGLQSFSDSFLHIRSPRALRIEGNEVEVSQIMQDIPDSSAHKCPHHTSNFESSAPNKVYSTEGRHVTRTETLESIIVENSALNTIYSLYSRVIPFMAKDKGTNAEDKQSKSEFFVEGKRVRSLPPSAFPCIQPKQSMVDSDSYVEEILNTFSSFFSVTDIPLGENWKDNKNKIVSEPGIKENLSHPVVIPPCITVVLSPKRNRERTTAGESLSKENSTSSLDSFSLVKRKGNKGGDDDVPKGRKKSLSPYPPVILPSLSISTTLFTRESNTQDRAMTEGLSPPGKDINILFSSLSAPEVPATEEIDNNSKDTTLPMGRKKKLSPFPPSVPPSKSIPIMVHPKKDNEHWTVVSRNCSTHNDNFSIIFSSTSLHDESTKEREEKNLHKISTGRKKRLSPYSPVILHSRPMLTKLPLEEGSERERKNEDGSTFSDKFCTCGSSPASKVPNEELREHKSKGTTTPTGRKTRLSPQPTTASNSQSNTVKQPPKEDYDKKHTTTERQVSIERKNTLSCSFADNLSPPDDSTREKAVKKTVSALGRKNSLLDSPPLVTLQSIFHQRNENTENSVEGDPSCLLCKSTSAPDMSTKEERGKEKRDTFFSVHPAIILPLKFNVAKQFRDGNEKFQTRRKEPISGYTNKDKFIASVSSPIIKVRGRRKEKIGRKRRLASRPPSISIPLDLQLQESKESTLKEESVQSEDAIKQKVIGKETTILPHPNHTYNLEDRKVKEIGIKIIYPIPYVENIKFVSSPLLLLTGKTKETKGEEINSERENMLTDHVISNQCKIQSLPTLSPKKFHIPPFTEKTESQKRDKETDMMARGPMDPRLPSIPRLSRSLLYTSSSDNAGANYSKRDLSESLIGHKDLRDDEEHIEELVNKRTFTSFDTGLSSVSTNKTVLNCSCCMEENYNEQGKLTSSKTQGMSNDVDSPKQISGTEHIASQKKVDQDIVKCGSNPSIRSSKNAGRLNKPDGELTKDTSRDAIYCRIPENTLDGTSEPMNQLRCIPTLSRTPDYSTLVNLKSVFDKKEDELAKTGKFVDYPIPELNHQQLSTNEKNKNSRTSITSRGISKTAELWSQAPSPPTKNNNNAVAEGNQDKQVDESIFLRTKQSPHPPTCLTSSRRPSPYEVAPVVLMPTRRSHKISRTEPLTTYKSLSPSPPPPPPATRIEPLVVHAAPRISSRVAPSLAPLLSVDHMMTPPVSVALAEAVALDDAKEVLRLLRIGINPNSTSQQGIPVLVGAVHLGSLNAAAALLSGGANPDARAPGGRTALHAAADIGRHRCVTLLLQHAAQVNAVDKYNQTALHLAARGGHETAVLALMAGGADPRLQDANGDSVVQVAHNPELRRLIRRKTIERLRRKCQSP